MKIPSDLYIAQATDLHYPSMVQTLGNGVSGDVIRAKLKTPLGNLLPVAIKTLRGSIADFEKNSLSKTCDEIIRMHMFTHHPHIVKLLGIVELPQDQIGVLMPVYRNLSLGTFIRQLSPLQMRTLLHHRFNIMIGIAEGLHTIHTSGYIHRDMKVENVLLDDFFMPVISDLGELKHVNGDGTFYSSHLAGTMPMLPPEIAAAKLATTEPFFEYSKSADIFGLGLIYWSLFAQLDIRNDLDLTKSQNESLSRIAEAGSMPTLWPHIPHGIVDLLRLMLSHNPGERPSIEALLRKLNSLKKNLEKDTSNLYEVTGEMPNAGNESLFIGKRPNSIDGVATLAFKKVQITSRPYEYNEAYEIARSIPKHPGLIEMCEKIFSDGHFFYVMEYAPNGSLRTRINSIDTLPTKEAKRIVESLVAAIHHLHAYGYLHRNLRLENIVFDKDGNPKLCDFKYTVMHDENGSYEGDESHHDLYFAAPEIAATRRLATDSNQPYRHEYPTHYSKQAEIFTLGLIIWAIYARLDRRNDIPTDITSSYDENTAHQLTATYIACGAIPELPAKMPRETKTIVSKMLQFNPANRPTSATVVATQLNPTIASGTQRRRGSGL